ncbi:PKD domain-containing protein [Geomonas ferrireducens]|uniref:PKD domain-containing protein n=1 Tax=Geomonas ferrireducens TaxID=2570227 RepID=UPI0010A8FA27|nr:PKD domain-containing protein [Geomonas ferrireducens]
MADLQKKADGKGIAYPGTVPSTGDAVRDSQTPGTSLYLFLNGGTGADGKPYPKVDLSLWDQATMCGTCHPGGIAYEEDRNGNRLPYKTLTDMAMGDVNPFTSTVWENFSAQGIESSFATIAPWVYPAYAGNRPDPSKPNNGAIIAPSGWGQPMSMPNPNFPGDATKAMPVYAKQLMVPNVKEMDCFFCHLSGYDNVMSSVMTQAGSLNAAPAAGAMLFDMNPASPTYMGYSQYNGNVTFADAGNGMQTVSLSTSLLGRIKGAPDSNNCMQCHATKTLKNLPEMFGVTGTSSGFLSSAPMIFDPNNGVGPNGKRMTSFDINAMWMSTGSSPVITMDNYTQYMMPGMPYVQAQQTFYSPASATGFMGGGNPAQSGPLYYYNSDGSMPDQNALKRSTMPFPRAEWFKRGDAWQAGQDVHGSFGCAGCHFTGNSTNKNQCDPGRGFDMSSTTQDGVPPLWKRQVVKEYDAEGKPVLAVGGEIAAAVQKHDTRNTVKRCEFCHITGKDYYGNPIQTFGAPNPDAAHTQYGLNNNIVQIVDKFDTEQAGFGGQGVPEHTNFTSDKNKLGRGNHLDVMDCTVCHVQKKSMAVRALDATSGMRFPAIVGTDPSKGMIGLFEDPAPDAFNAGAVAQYNQMFAAINQAMGLTEGMPGYQAPIPAGTHVVGGALKEWKPLNLWQRLGNMEAPLSFGNSDKSGMKFRRKIYLSNAISAVIWNNTDSNVDANGDTVPGGDLVPTKPSLVGYTDVFDGLPPHENNTQGYGEPIYDPWIQRDLKAGMNFGPSALSVISIGFNDPMSTASGSAFMPDGTFSPANYWKYVSVWSGAVNFTEPYQITDYKNYRNQLESMKPAALRKDWTKTELAYIGAPFMVTHGVKPVQQYVKGKSCADCHAPGAGFFKGGFDMVGTAIPADHTFNPTSQVSIDQTSGTVTRIPGIPSLDSASNLMGRPLEPVRVKAKLGDLRTAFEGFNKLGQPRTVKFQKSDANYTWTTDLERADILYPPEDGAIYYKIADTNDDGSIKTGATPVNGIAYADYMESIAQNFDATAAGLGVKPVATIAAVNGETGTNAAMLIKGTSYNFAPATTPAAGAKFQWATNAGDTAVPPAVPGAIISAPAAANTGITFTKAGTFRVALTVTNVDGTTATSYKLVNVANPVYIAVTGTTTAPVTTTIPATATRPAYSYTVQQTQVPVTFTLTPPTYDKVRFFWGDGSSSTTLTAADFATANGAGGVAHVYNRYSKYLNATTNKYTYKTTIQLFNGSTLVSSQSVKVEVQ